MNATRDWEWQFPIGLATLNGFALGLMLFVVDVFGHFWWAVAMWMVYFVVFSACVSWVRSLGRRTAPSVPMRETPDG